MAYTTIALNPPHRIENATVSGAIYPGMLCLPYVGVINVHGTAGGTVCRCIALEDDLQGEDVDHVYTTANEGRFGWFLPGDDVVLLMHSGAGTFADGNFLESAGDGTVRKISDDVVSYTELQSIIGIAREAKTYSAATIAGRGVRVTLI